MRTKPAYTECRIFYDGNATVDVGHFLKTPGGSAYRVQSVRQDRKRAYRLHLVCLRWPVEEIPAESIVHPLHWYARKRKRAMSLDRYAGRLSA